MSRNKLQKIKALFIAFIASLPYRPSVRNAFKILYRSVACASALFAIPLSAEGTKRFRDVFLFDGGGEETKISRIIRNLPGNEKGG